MALRSAPFTQRLVLLLPVLAAACSSGGALPAQPVSYPDRAPAAQRFIVIADEKEPVAVATPAPPYSGSASTTWASTVRGVLAASNTNDYGGQAGILMPVQVAQSGIGVYAAMSAYDGLQLHQPADAGTTNTLYAPTTHGAGGDCIELSTAYWRAHGTADTQRYVRLYDFCDKGGTWEDQFDKRIDSGFVNSYVRVFTGGSGLPEYTTEQLREADGKWHVLIYNYAQGRWADWGYSAAGTTAAFGGDGWSIFEMHYASGDCSALPNIGVDGLQELTPNGWRLLDAVTSKLYNSNSGCFSSGGVTMYALTSPSYSRWVVAGGSE